jgi:tRNA(Arg) A34 adenosine deaminase TadA/SAM-dependent methyltransferase/fido (protein-threonine AMPylation protein)
VRYLIKKDIILNSKLDTPVPDSPLSDRVLEKLLEETQLAIDAGDLPVGCVLTVGDTLLDSNRNTIRSQQGRRFHAERNLLAQLGDLVIPAGRRVVWVTLEPCLRCAQAIQRFGADEVVYVLDDPFGGGKSLLVQAGITVTRRGEWERDYLRLMMDSFARYPEFCADRQFRFALDAWQRHEPLGHDEQVKAVFLHHLAPYLPNVPTARQDEVRRAFLAHVNCLTRMTLEECVGVSSVAFVRKLHRALFPPDYRHRAVGNDGVANETASGEWRRHVLWPHYTEFSALEAIEADLSSLLNRLSAKVSWQREDVLHFFFDFTTIHPFTDANGRMASILADVICLNHGLAPLALDIKNLLFKTALWEDVRGGAPVESQLRLVDGWNRGQVGIKPLTIYDNMPSAFQTFIRRSGNKQHVVEHILAKLAGRNLEPHFVVTDIGAGTGFVADGILHGMLQREGMTLEYHYLEPSQTSVDYFRAHSRYAALPQVVTHTMPLEDYLLPPSDLIVVSQALQHIANPMETMHDIVSALKPGGLALVVVTHPEGDEFAMVNRLTPLGQIYPQVKIFLDKQGIEYEEVGVETLLRITPSDRDTPEGDDLPAFCYPAHTLLPALKDAFWSGLAEFARDGGVMRQEAFFWLRRKGSGEAGSMNNLFPPETRHLQEAVLSGIISASE